MSLFHKDHFLDRIIGSGIDVIEVNATGKISRIKGNQMLAGILSFIDQRNHFLSQYVEDTEMDKSGIGNGVYNSG